MELPDLNRLAPRARWSVCVLDADTGRALAEHEADARVPTASVAKVFALVELADRLERRELEGGQLLDRRRLAPVHDSGLWQHLRVDALPVEDVAVLVGAVSDNLATNVLVDLLGLEQVQRRAAATGPGGSTLHDVVRDHRSAGDPATLSTGCARDWAGVLAGLHRGEVASPAASARVLGWLAAGTDLSMVAAAYDLDPLAHGAEDLGVRLWNKTGTDVGVRADVGLVRAGEQAVAWAVLAGWAPGDDERADRAAVLAGMRAVGERVRAFLHG